MEGKELGAGDEDVPALPAPSRILGNARVYLKVSILVEAGEAVRHFAAFTPLRTTLSGSLLPSRDTRPLAPLPSSPPPPTPTRRAQAREGGSEKARLRREPRRRRRFSALEAEPSLKSPLCSRPRATPAAARAHSRRRAVSASGEKGYRGTIRLAPDVFHLLISPTTLCFLALLFPCVCRSPSSALFTK